MFLTFLIFSTCDDKQATSTSNGKSRKELLKEFPYGGEIIKDEIKAQINSSIEIVIEQIESLNEIAIFYVTTSNEIIRHEGNWANGTEATNHANLLWKDLDLIMTLVNYPSFSQNAVNGDISEMWIIEVEHKKVSRTCRMFFDDPLPTELTTLRD